MSLSYPTPSFSTSNSPATTRITVHQPKFGILGVERKITEEEKIAYAGIVSVGLVDFSKWAAKAIYRKIRKIVPIEKRLDAIEQEMAAIPPQFESNFLQSKDSIKNLTLLAAGGLAATLIVGLLGRRKPQIIHVGK
jgi:hypothetical protein